jgi:predicted amidohydrolase
MDSEPFPTDPPGEVVLKYRKGYDGATVLIERRFYDPPDRVVVYVPVDKLWQLLIDNAESFRFEEYTADQLRDAIDFAIERGWSR